jgi:cobalt-precorrin-5B (C1)-methyltransferase
MLDVHSARGMADLDALAAVAEQAGAMPDLATRMRAANTVAEAFSLAAEEDIPLGDAIASAAWSTAAAVLKDTGIELELLVFNRDGELMGRKDFSRV